MENRSAMCAAFAAHAKAHPAMRPQDAAKLAYQAAFGAEHLVLDETAAHAYFKEEFAAVEPREVPLCEDVSIDLCRVDLGAWKARGLPGEWLLRAFLLTASPPPADAEAAFRGCLAAAQALADGGALPFSGEEYRAFAQVYFAGSIRPVRHSAEYRAAEKPAYRLVRKSISRLFPLLEKMNARKGDVAVVALDGRCASGKTSMASDLAAIAGAGVVHMDDFFLPAELRTAQRLAMPGGNAHFERFREEVLPFLASPEAFSYRVFDCGAMGYSGRREVAASRWRLVEGAYCCHPTLGDYMNLRAFSDVDSQTQLARIRQRDGGDAAKTYAAHWIPMEEAYLAAFGIRQSAHVIL